MLTIGKTMSYNLSANTVLGKLALMLGIASKEPQPVQSPAMHTRPISVVAEKEGVTFSKGSHVIQMDWRSVPPFIAYFRAALVPDPISRILSELQVNAALEMASIWCEFNEVVFTRRDAEDIVRNHGQYLLKRCPDRSIARELRHVRNVGPKKLFNYIDDEVEVVFVT